MADRTPDPEKINTMKYLIYVNCCIEFHYHRISSMDLCGLKPMIHKKFGFPTGSLEWPMFGGGVCFEMLNVSAAVVAVLLM